MVKPQKNSIKYRDVKVYWIWYYYFWISLKPFFQVWWPDSCVALLGAVVVRTTAPGWFQPRPSTSNQRWRHRSGSPVALTHTWLPKPTPFRPVCHHRQVKTWQITSDSTGEHPRKFFSFSLKKVNRFWKWSRIKTSMFVEIFLAYTYSEYRTAADVLLEFWPILFIFL